MTAAAQPTKAASKAPKGKTNGAAVTTTKKEKVEGPRYTRKEYDAPKEGFKLYEAGPSAAGFINVRAHNKVMLFAAEISDPSGQHPNPDWHVGLISRYFTNKEKADKYKADREAEGYAVKIVPVRPYTGPVTK